MRDDEAPAQPAHVEDDDFALDTSSLDARGNTPSSVAAAALRSGRARAATLGATALLVVVIVVGLFARATSDPGAAVATLLRLATPTPTAPLPLSAGTVYFSNGAPWGVLTIDGHRLPSADLMGYGVSFTPGAHHLTYQARYFPSLHCIVSAPRAPSDTCPLDTSASASQFLLGQGLARVVDLGSTGATLQPDQRDKLTQLVDSALKAQTLSATIAPGDRYLNGQGQLVGATSSLRFTLTLALDNSGISGVGSYCAQFCPDPSFTTGGQLDSQQWPTRVHVTSYWTITDASGRSITPLTYQAGQPYPGFIPVDVGIQLTPAGWQIGGLEQLDTNATINAAQAALSKAVDAEGGDDYGSGATLVNQSNPLEGCLLDTSFRGQSSRLLWRFGALVAVDSTAHRVFPHLPMANAAEQAVAYNTGQPTHP